MSAAGFVPAAGGMPDAWPRMIPAKEDEHGV
jgi:hypothetical protein